MRQGLQLVCRRRLVLLLLLLLLLLSLPSCRRGIAACCGRDRRCIRLPLQLLLLVLIIDRPLLRRLRLLRWLLLRSGCASGACGCNVAHAHLLRR